MLSLGSHSSSDSYMSSVAQRPAVRIWPNGAMKPGSCSRAQVAVPPVGTFLAARRKTVAPAGPARAPATIAPAPTRPALAIRSRLENSRARGKLSVGLSVAMLPFLLFGGDL